jgi:hypothetical protein
MNKQPEALRLADELESEWFADYDLQNAAAELRRLHEENTALRQAIEQAEKQDPVAWMLPEYGDVLSAAEVGGKPGIYNIPLYTAPPRKDWVGLDVDDIDAIQIKVLGGGFGLELTNFASAIEAKLRERNERI